MGEPTAASLIPHGLTVEVATQLSQKIVVPVQASKSRHTYGM